ncbi:MAG: transposase zinc-binding domain-containing protein [Segetibacter sp.]
MQQLLQQMPQWKERTSQGSHTVLSRIERCRTADYGYHAYRCSDGNCGAMQYVYHSCRNRHCPGCGQQQKRRMDRSTYERTLTGKILPCSLYHTPSVKQPCHGQP